MAKLTVLMPVYNAEKFLAEAIDSILAQTFRDFEFLIIDDGSSDNSVAIILSYTDNRIRLYRNEKNMGITPTLNKGIRLAQSPIIARMDADDICYPDRLQKQYAYLLQNSDCALVSSLVRVISEDKKFIRQDQFKTESFYYNLTFICWIYHPTIMFRKQAVISINGYTAAYSEDYELFWQLTRHYKCYNLPEVLLDYRETSQSLHQVLKKPEYEYAQQQQVLRNIRYFTGPEYQLPENFLAALRHNFEPLLTEANVKNLIACVKALDLITCAILAKPNPNYHAAAIKKAALHKKNFMVWNFAQKLPFLPMLYFLVSVFSLKEGLKSLRAYVKSRRTETKATAPPLFTGQTIPFSNPETYASA